LVAHRYPELDANVVAGDTEWSGAQRSGTILEEGPGRSFRPGPESGPIVIENRRIGVLERNRVVAQRIARVLAGATGLSGVACEEDPAGLRAALGQDPILIACDITDLDLVLEWGATRYPNLRVLTWSTSATTPAIEAALRDPRVISVVGWPTFESMPRPWEVGLAARRMLDPQGAPPRLSEMVGWGATNMKWRPRTTEDRDLIVQDVARVAEAAGAAGRVAQRLAEVAHELLMNAMYDAPVNEHGLPRYAHDRKQEISLEDDDVPVFRLATDGVHLGLQATDRFGRLRRQDLFRGILRGQSARASSGEVLDTSSGGAGLGLFKIYSSSAVMISDVKPGEYTMVTSVFDLDVGPRDFRTMPISLHAFEQP
jgi:hypothetical protein